MARLHATAKRRVARTAGGLALALAFLTIGNACASGSRELSIRTVPGPHTRALSAVNGFALYSAPQATWALQLAAMQSHGIEAVRSDAVWAQVEPIPPGPLGHVYQFANLDPWVLTLALDHMTWQPIIDYSVGWAGTCSRFCAPTSDAPYAAFAQAVAARYGPHGSFWAQYPGAPYQPVQIFEIWNEENSSQYNVPAARYATLYLAARSAIRSVDPQATVIVGGLSEDAEPQVYSGKDYPGWYVAQLIKTSPALKGSIDGFGLHPYSPSAAVSAQRIADLRGALSASGLGSVPIYVTEFGWPTGDSTQEAWRAKQMIALGFTLSRTNCDIRELAPYDWINPVTSDPQNDFGFVDQTAISTALRPAGTAWFNGLAQGKGAPTLGLCVAPKSPHPKPPPKKKKKKKKRHNHNHNHH